MIQAEKGERLAKVIARTGYCSRREAEELILEGSVKVNGEVITNCATVITDHSIKINNKLLNPKEPTKMWIFHKPKGCIVTKNDPQKRKNIYEFLPKELQRTIPIGRLDMDTEGLLLLTNNGELSRYIELPNTAWTRQYRVKVHGFTDRIVNNIDKLATKGVKINDTLYAPIKVSLEKAGNTNTWFKISITEGKNREVRNIMEYFGLQVLKLIRTSYGPFHLGNLPICAIKPVKNPALKEAIGNKIRLD